MRRAASGLRTDVEPRIAELERANPEWRAWLAMLREVARVLDQEEWATLRTGRPAEIAASDDAPLLHGVGIRVPPARLQSLMTCLADRAAAHAGAAEAARSLASYRPSQPDALAAISAAIECDDARLAHVAQNAGVDQKALHGLAILAALPVLRACALALESAQTQHWSHGYCPFCGAWPVLAELRGIDRSRRLRCGRCSGDWQMIWLKCVHCGESHHERLGSLGPEGALETRKVETCLTCRRYLKSSATLGPLGPIDLLLRDLETVELDLVALDRGYSRPERPGYQISLSVDG